MNSFDINACIQHWIKKSIYCIIPAIDWQENIIKKELLEILELSDSLSIYDDIKVFVISNNYIESNNIDYIIMAYKIIENKDYFYIGMFNISEKKLFMKIKKLGKYYTFYDENGLSMMKNTENQNITLFSILCKNIIFDN